MARGRKVSKPQRATDPPRGSSRLPHNSQASQVSKFECPSHSCSSLGSKDALKRHLQGHDLTKDPDISEEMIHQAGFMICTICKAVLVTARRNRCTSCTSSCRTACSSAKSSCTETSTDPVASQGHSVSSQVSLSPSSPMSPAQEVSMTMGGGRSSREPVSRVLDMQVHRTAKNTLPGLIFLGLPESNPPIVTTDPHTSMLPYRHSMTSLSSPIVTRSSTTQPDLLANEHPVTSLTHASLWEVSDNTESTEPARASSSHLLQSDSPRASNFFAIHADNETDLHLAVPSCSSFSRDFSETPHISSPPQTSSHVHLSVTFFAYVSDIWTAKHVPITRLTQPREEALHSRRLYRTCCPFHVAQPHEHAR